MTNFDRILEQLKRDFELNQNFKAGLLLAIKLQRAGRFKEFYNNKIDFTTYSKKIPFWGKDLRHDIMDEMGKIGYLRRPNQKEISKAITMTTKHLRGPGVSIRNTGGRTLKCLHIKNSTIDNTKDFKQRLAENHPSLLRSGEMPDFSDDLIDEWMDRVKGKYDWSDPDSFDFCFLFDRGEYCTFDEWGGDEESISYFRKNAMPGDDIDLYVRDKNYYFVSNADMPIPHWVDPVSKQFIF